MKNTNRANPFQETLKNQTAGFFVRSHSIESPETNLENSLLQSSMQQSSLELINGTHVHESPIINIMNPFQNNRLVHQKDAYNKMNKDSHREWPDNDYNDSQENRKESNRATANTGACVKLPYLNRDKLNKSPKKSVNIQKEVYATRLPELKSMGQQS